MFTLNKLEATLKQLVNNHLILNEWYFNNPWEETSGGTSIKYPMMFGQLQPNRVDDNIDITVIRLCVADRVLKDRSNELDVLSDTKQICKDVIVYLKKSNFGEPLIIDTNITLNDFTERFDDEVSGWYFDIQIKTKFDFNLCSVPISGVPTIGGGYESYIVNQDGDTIATLLPGQTYTVEQLQQVIQTLTDPAPITITQTL